MRIMRVCRSTPAQIVSTLRRGGDPAGLLERQEDRKRAADTLPTVDANLPAVQLNEMADARQPDSFAGICATLLTRVFSEDERKLASRLPMP